MLFDSQLRAVLDVTTERGVRATEWPGDGE